jgi:hypothetical protein
MAFVQNKSMADYEPPKIVSGVFESIIKKASYTSNGSVHIIAEIAEGDFAGRQVGDFIQLDESKMTEDWQVAAARKRQDQVQKALGVDFASGFDTDDLVDKTCRIQFGGKKDYRTGEIEDSIVKYLPIA